MKKTIFLLLLSIFMTSCTSIENKTTSYVGPGSEYSIAFNDSANTFELIESTTSLTINGSFTTLATGFKKLTMSSVTGGNGNAPTAGDQAYGVDIPGVVFLLKPLGENTEIISMVSKGSCPTEDFNLNWVITRIDRDEKLTNTCGSGDTGVGSLGTFSFNSSTEMGLLPNQFDICGDTVSTDESLGKITCSAGIGTPENESESKMYLTSNGGAIVKITDNNQTIVALPVNKISHSADMSGDYIGLVMINNGDGIKTTVHTVKSSANSSGVFSFDEINPDTGENISSNIHGTSRMTAINSPADGFTTGTYDLGWPY